jgi:hypothetical protein
MPRVGKGSDKEERGKSFFLFSVERNGNNETKGKKEECYFVNHLLACDAIF